MDRYDHSKAVRHLPDAHALLTFAVVVTFAAFATTVHADATVDATSSAPVAAAPAGPPPSLPWMMRPTVAGTTVRLDTSIAKFDGGLSAVFIAGGTYRIIPDLALGTRIGGITWSEGDRSATAFINPALFALWTPQWNLPVRLSFSAAIVLPIGQGGSVSADPDIKAATGAGLMNRSAMDNALFQTSYFTVIGGTGLSWHGHGVTLAAEATVLQLIRVYDVPSDAARTNLTTGIHAGWTFWGPLNVSTELHYQRWLSTPQPVHMDPSRRDQWTWLVGLRATFAAGPVKLRPGFSYTLPLDAPMSRLGYHVFQIDLPIVF